MSSAFFFAAARSASVASGLTAIEDVRGLSLLLLRVGLRRALVLRLHLVGRHRRLRQQRIGCEDHVLELRLFRRLERGRVLLVERLHLRVVDLHVLHERLGVDRRDFHFALLLDEVEEPRGGCLRHDAAARDRVDDLLVEELSADAVLERGLRDARLAEQALVEVERKLVALAKSRIRGDSLEDLVVGDPEMEVVRLLLDQALAQQLLQQVEAHFGIVEDRRIDVLLRVTPQRVLLVADGARELLLADVTAVEFRDFPGGIGPPEVIVDAEEGERHHDQRQDDLRDAIVFVKEVVHQLPIIS